jgi:hypothetical protein
MWNRLFGGIASVSGGSALFQFLAAALGAQPGVDTKWLWIGAVISFLSLTIFGALWIFTQPKTPVAAPSGSQSRGVEIRGGDGGKGRGGDVTIRAGDGGRNAPGGNVVITGGNATPLIQGRKIETMYAGLLWTAHCPIVGSQSVHGPFCPTHRTTKLLYKDPAQQTEAEVLAKSIGGRTIWVGDREAWLRCPRDDQIIPVDNPPRKLRDLYADAHSILEGDCGAD